jgi:transcriptional regulator with GAF, ATPase, and Fis domain
LPELIPISFGACQGWGVNEKTPDASDGLDAQRRETAESANPAGLRGRPSSQATGDVVRQDLTQAMADLARRLQRQSDPQSVMNVIVSAVVGTIPGAEEATVSLVHNRQRVLSAAFTSDRARRFDELQQETHEGPCLDAMYQQRTVRVGDLLSDPRWPQLARKVAEELGVASMLSFQLFVHANDLGSLNLLARRPNAFTDESERVGLLFATHAAIAVADAQDLNHVAKALASRDTISQAKGILMERYKITAPMAFALLAKTSQDTNTRLNDVAEILTQTGMLGP